MAIPVKDKGYSWVILTASTLLNMLMASSYSTNGIYYVEFIQYFQVDKTELSWIGACQLFFTGVAAMCGGTIIQAYGYRTLVSLGSVFLAVGYIPSVFVYNHRVLYFTLGIFTGMGFGFYFLAGVVSVQQYFDKRRSTAAGIATVGLSVGTFLWPPAVERFILLFGWRGALLIHCAIAMNGLVLGALMRPFPEPDRIQTDKSSSKLSTVNENYPNIKLDNDRHRKKSEGCLHQNNLEPKESCIVIVGRWSSLVGISLLKNPGFGIFCVAGFCMQIGHIGPFSFLPLRAVELGVSKQKAAFLTSTVAAFSGVSRFIVGIVGDKFPHHRPLMCGIGIILTSVLAFISVFLTQYWMLVCYAALFGTIGATYIALFASVTVDTVGVAEVARGLGVSHFISIMGSSVSFPISGALIDATGDAASPFCMFGCANVIAGVFYCIVQCLVTRRRHRHDTADNDIHLQTEVKVIRHELETQSVASFGSAIIA